MNNKMLYRWIFIHGFCGGLVFGAPVTRDQAALAANTFITITYPAGRQQTALTTTAVGQSARAVQAVRTVIGSGGQPIGYVAELDSTGYVLLSSDDEAPPVKCYTDSGSYDQLPPEFLDILTTELAEDLFVLSGMNQTKSGGLSTASQTQTAGVSKFREQWSALLNPEPPTEQPTAMSTSATAGTVLLTTTWHQNDPYNYYCSTAVGGPGGRALAGCTACAVSQILRYWNRPTAVFSDHSYYDSKGSCTGSHSISTAGMSAYNWANMPNSITTGSSTAQKQAVGQLMYHAAVALDSDFESDGTSADPTDVPAVLRTYFSYTCSNYLQKTSFTSTEWYNRIASDVGANKPIFYAMWESDGDNGHAVVCDGYRSGNQIHLNLGWSGSGNAWYNIDSVSASGYTWTKHSAVFGIAPIDPPDSLANDNFMSAKTLAESSGTISSNTLNATIESGEPAHAGKGPYKSVWYTFTPSSSGTLTIDTHGSAFDTVLAIYTGSSVASLSAVASNDDDGSSENNSGLTAISLTAGTTYRIAVAGYSSSSAGSFKLNWIFSGSSTGTLQFKSSIHSVEENGGSIRILVSRAGNASSAASVTYATTNGSATAGTDYVGKSGTLNWLNGDATDKYFDLAIIDDSAAESAETFTVTLSNVSGAILGSPNKTTVTIVGPNDQSSAPANDNFASSKTLSVASGMVSSNTMNTTVEIGEPTHAGRGPYNSVWYKFTPASDGTLTIDTHGSVFDTVLAIYTGSSIGGLTVVASNDDDGSSSNNSGLTAIPLTAGITYRIVVAGYGSTSLGAFTLNWIFSDQSTPANKFLYTTVGSKVTITGYIGSGGAVTIPSTIGGLPVTSIGVQAFYSCDSLTSLVIPDSIVSIGLQAFYSCDSLTSVRIGNGTTSIGSQAFYSCDELDSIIISNSAVTIGSQAFYSCDKLTRVILGQRAVSIGLQAFYSCGSLTNIIIPGSVASIGQQAFYWCDGLTTVTISSGGTSIENQAFIFCDNLKGVYFKGNAPKVGLNVFFGDDYVTVYRPDKTTGWPLVPGLWAGCPTALWNPLYSLFIDGGDGGGDSYTNGQKVAITATSPAIGKKFDRWTGSVAYVANATSATTTVTMPAQDIALTATYKAAYYKLTVIGGTGGGSFTNNQRVTIRASIPAGMKFSQWNDGDTNVSRIITMPPEPVTCTANFTDNAKPTVAITAPTALQKVYGTTGDFIVRGTAADNFALSNVMVKVNSGSFVPASPATTNGLKSWMLPVVLSTSLGGTNTIAAYSVDTTGNSSSTVTVKCVYVETGTLNIITNGPGKVTVAPTGPLLLNKTYTLTAAAGIGGIFSNWTGAVLNPTNKVTTFVMTSNITISANFTDTAKPALVITYPANNAKVLTNGLVIIRGTAADNDVLKEIKYQRYDGTWTNAVSTNVFKAWAAPYVPAAGLNTSKVYSVDMQDNHSATSTVVFTYIPGAVLTVQTNLPAGGTITPSLNGKVLQIGSTNTLTATAKAKYVFTDWTAGVGGSLVTTGKVVKFVITNDMVLTANFRSTAIPDAVADGPATPQAAIVVDGSSKDWTGIPRSAFSYASVTQEVAVALSGNNIALLLTDCPFDTSDTVLVYFKLRLIYGVGDNRHTVDLWTSGSVLYGMVDGQVITGLEAVLLDGVLEVKIPVEQAPAQVMIEEVGCGMDLGGGTLTEFFRLVPQEL